MKKNDFIPNENFISDLDNDFMIQFENRFNKEQTPEWFQTIEFEVPWVQISYAVVLAIIMSSEYQHFHQGLISLRMMAYTVNWSSAFFMLLASIVMLAYFAWPKLNLDSSIFIELNNRLDLF